MFSAATGLPKRARRNSEQIREVKRDMRHTPKPSEVIVCPEGRTHTLERTVNGLTGCRADVRQ